MSMPTPIQVRDPNRDISLPGHAVIEASAGTGKTYTIEHLVLRLVRDHHLSPDKIVVVTYTEKATGELKARVRAKLQQAFDREPGNQHLRDALDTFDSMPISTIHGFCQRALQIAPFASPASLQAELLNDESHTRSILHDIMRREWPKEYGDDLAMMLGDSGYPGSSRNDWESTILRLAERYRPQCGDLLLPKSGAQAPHRRPADERRRLLLDVIHDLRIACDIHHQRTPGACDFLLQYEEAPMRDTSIQARIRSIVKPLLLLLLKEDEAITDQDVRSLLDAAQQTSSFDRHGFDVLYQGYKTDQDPFMEHFLEKLQTVAGCLSRLRQLMSSPGGQYRLAADTLRLLATRARQARLQAGKIAFDDMLVLVDQALDPQHNPAWHSFRQALRDRFQVALVDEFQDTDPLQWRIFSRLFLEDASEHTLMLIGDPKQAIYSFRGADIAIYQQAVRTMIADYGAAYYSLVTNYRSSADLISGFNHLFTTIQLFDGTGIECPPVEAPEDAVASSTPNREAICLLPCESTSSGPLLHELGRRICAEIQYLLNPACQDSWIYDKALNKRRAVRPDDICILVRSRRECRLLAHRLNEAGLPVSMYRQTGLYQSREAFQLSSLLHAIANPADHTRRHEALLTDFFAVSPQDLVVYVAEGLPSSFTGAFSKWLALADAQQWSAFFEAISQDTGILIRHASKASGRQTIANFRQLTRELCVVAYERRLSLEALLDVLALRMHPTLGGDAEEGHHESSSHDPCIRLMTIHASKGLEFPLVFLAGGFTQNRSHSFYTFHRDGSRVFDLACAEENKDAHLAEEDFENRRLLYVALTRASHRLYLPALAEKVRFLNGFTPTLLSQKMPHHPTPALPLTLLHDERPVPLPLLADDFNELFLEDLPVDQPPPTAVPPPAVELRSYQPPPYDLGRRQIVIESFSSLHAYHGSDVLNFEDFQNPGSDILWKIDEEDDPGDGLERGLLPSSCQFGSMMHYILEMIDFASLQSMTDAGDLLDADSPSCKLILDAVERYGMGNPVSPITIDDRLQAIAAMVWHTLKTPLPGLEASLSELQAGELRHEIEFYVTTPVTADEGDRRLQQLRPGYLHGFIDLLFQWRGKLYILDWKTNFLSEGYHQEALEQAMAQSDYHLQYQIYRIAADRWLHMQGYPGRIQGAFYLFLRGLDVEKSVESGEGIFYCSFS